MDWAGGGAAFFGKCLARCGCVAGYDLLMPIQASVFESDRTWADVTWLAAFVFFACRCHNAVILWMTFANQVASPLGISLRTFNSHRAGCGCAA